LLRSRGDAELSPKLSPMQRSAEEARQLVEYFGRPREQAGTAPAHRDPGEQPRGPETVAGTAQRGRDPGEPAFAADPDAERFGERRALDPQPAEPLDRRHGTARPLARQALRAIVSAICACTVARIAPCACTPST
jgi:hypothetical protein